MDVDTHQAASTGHFRSVYSSDRIKIDIGIEELDFLRFDRVSARRASKIEFDPIHWPGRTVTTRRDIVNRLTVDAN